MVVAGKQRFSLRKNRRNRERLVVKLRPCGAELDLGRLQQDREAFGFVLPEFMPEIEPLAHTWRG